MPVSSVYSPWAYISGKSLVAMVITTDKHTYVNQSQLRCKQLEFYIWFIEIIALKLGLSNSIDSAIYRDSKSLSLSQ